MLDCSQIGFDESEPLTDQNQLRHKSSIHMKTKSSSRTKHEQREH